MPFLPLSIRVVMMEEKYDFARESPTRISRGASLNGLSERDA
jgi:hypothetical protein